MAIRPDVRIPSVNAGPKKFCMFGVKRKGTASFDAKIGAWFAIPSDKDIETSSTLKSR